MFYRCSVWHPGGKKKDTLMDSRCDLWWGNILPCLGVSYWRSGSNPVSSEGFVHRKWVRLNKWKKNRHRTECAFVMSDKQKGVMLIPLGNALICPGCSKESSTSLLSFYDSGWWESKVHLTGIFFFLWWLFLACCTISLMFTLYLAFIPLSNPSREPWISRYCLMV